MEGVDDGYGTVVAWHKNVAEIPLCFVQLLQRYEVGVVFFQAGVDDTSPYNDDIRLQFIDSLDEGLEVSCRYIRDSGFPEGVCGSRQEKLDVVGKCQSASGRLVAVGLGERLHGLGKEPVRARPFFYAIRRFFAQPFPHLYIYRADGIVGRRVFPAYIGALLVIDAVGMIAIEAGTQHQYLLSSYTFMVAGTNEGLEHTTLHIMFFLIVRRHSFPSARALLSVTSAKIRWGKQTATIRIVGFLLLSEKIHTLRV